MSSAINNRIRQIIKTEKITQETFCSRIGIPLSTLKTSFQRDSSPNFELMYRVAENFPAYSMDWLITGKGDMLKPQTTEEALLKLTKDIKEINEDDAIPRQQSDIDLIKFLSDQLVDQEKTKLENEKLREENNKLLKEISELKSQLLDIYINKK